eukprot:15156592-Alexandrium_andersonii.AAC.1
MGWADVVGHLNVHNHALEKGPVSPERPCRAARPREEAIEELTVEVVEGLGQVETSNLARTAVRQALLAPELSAIPGVVSPPSGEASVHTGVRPFLLPLLEVSQPSPGPEPIHGRSHHEQPKLQGVPQLDLFGLRQSYGTSASHFLGPPSPRLYGIEHDGQEVECLDGQQPQLRRKPTIRPRGS